MNRSYNLATAATDEAIAPALPPLPAVTISLPLDRSPAHVYLARLGEGSRRAMVHSLETSARILTAGRVGWDAFPWHGLRYQHTQALRTALAAQYAPATANRILAAVRGVLREAWRLGLMSADDSQRAADLQPVRGETLPRGRALSAGELRSLFAACADSPIGTRDAALLAVLYAAGLRRSEAVALDVSDYDRETGALTVRSGKGSKARVVYATNGAAEALSAWLDTRGDAPGPLFLPVGKGGRILYRRMNDASVRTALMHLAEVAGVAAFTPHDLRRSMISDLLDAGADVVTVQKLAGHANVTTTARYDRRGEAAKQKAAAMLHVPYFRRQAR